MRAAYHAVPRPEATNSYIGFMLADFGANSAFGAGQKRADRSALLSALPRLLDNHSPDRVFEILGAFGNTVTAFASGRGWLCRRLGVLAFTFCRFGHAIFPPVDARMLRRCDSEPAKSSLSVSNWPGSVAVQFARLTSWPRSSGSSSSISDGNPGARMSRPVASSNVRMMLGERSRDP